MAISNRRLLPLNLNKLVGPGPLPFERRLASALPIVVFYTGAVSSYSPYRDVRYAYSQLVMPKGPVQFTTEGWITIPNRMEVRGSLADDRLSRLLPADWKTTPLETLPATVAGATVLSQNRFVLPDARLGRIADAFTERFRTLAPAVFVQIDKSVYATGDHIWLSAYLLDAPTHRLPVGETALQVDLLTPAGRLVQHQWLHVTDGRAVGNFRLSDSLASGTYRLRAYTDEDDGQYRPAFERSVAVYNLLRTPAPGLNTLPADTAKSSLDVQFLPEGGRWVVGMPARLGLKAVGTDGRGKPVAGRVIDNTGQESGRFVTNAFGMGSVVLMPQPSRTYYAEVPYAGQNQLVKLPTAELSGLTLSVDAVSDTNQLGIRVVGARQAVLDSV